MRMSNHLREAYLRRLREGELNENDEREREEVLDLRDEENNLRSRSTYFSSLCRRMRVSRAAHLYLPELEEGVEVALADASALLKVLESWEETSPVTLIALRRALAGQWFRVDEHEVERDSRDLAVRLFQVEVELTLMMGVAAAEETSDPNSEEQWGTPEEDEQRRMAVVPRARRLEEASARAVDEVAQQVFRFYE